MVAVQPDINTLFDWSFLRREKEALLHQHARVVWMCGLSGAGKSTLASRLDRMLIERGFLTQVIDGDVIRNGLNKGLGFSTADRHENLRRVAELANLFTHCGVISIVSFISPTHESRKLAKSIIGEQDFSEVYVNAPLSICEMRDVKGLYKQARQGLIPNFTGIDSPFEAPVKPDLEIKTDKQQIDACANELVAFLLPLISY
jgi:adenylylsulfate kinase